MLLTIRQLGAEDWPNYRGRNHDGISSETNWTDQWPKSGPRELWRTNVGVGFTSCSIANDRLFVGGNMDGEESLYCIHATTGKRLWKYTYECDLDDRFFEGGPTSTPTIDGDRVYFLSRPGDLLCLEADTGKLNWSKNLPESVLVRVPGWGFAGSPVVQGERLILNVGESGLALDKLTGDMLWKSGDAEAGYMTPFPFQMENKWFALIASGKFYHCVDLESGSVLWKHRWLTTYGCNAASPIVFGSNAFFSSGYGRGSTLVALKSDSYEVVWANKGMQNQFNSSVLIDGSLYGFDGDEGGEVFFKCMDFAAGGEHWSYPGLGSGALTAANGKLIILSQNGELIIANASSKEFSPTSKAKVLDGKCWTVPVLCNGKIYCRNAAGDVVCLDVRPPN
ncbi:MAG: PQQ-binding-like beta-propeller repeat protein [Pirellula sp.]